MFKREDFYKINEETLKSFFEKTEKENILYIYPEMNAIIKKYPSQAVKDYLYTEFNINGSFIKRVLVWLYTRVCLNSFGLFAKKRIKFNADITEDMLIYPCNRKFRIFDFKKNIVSVVVKSGFSNHCLLREISFRNENKNCEFILPISESSEISYTEKIIDGVPLARLQGNIEAKKSETLRKWVSYSEATKETVSSKEYAQNLKEQFLKLKEEIIRLKKKIDYEGLDKVSEMLFNKIGSSDENIELILSHGDLQEGNIWIENGTGKIYIIDWESVLKRSIWYDEAVLYNNLRNADSLFEKLAENEIRWFTVTAEELIYRMDELTELPANYGADNFVTFINKLSERIENV